MIYTITDQPVDPDLIEELLGYTPDTSCPQCGGDLILEEEHADVGIRDITLYCIGMDCTYAD